MFGFLLIIAWILFGVVGVHTEWPAVKEVLFDWWTGGPRVYSTVHTGHPKHLRT